MVYFISSKFGTFAVVLRDFIILACVSSTSFVSQVKLSRGKLVVITIDAFVVVLSNFIILDHSFSELSAVVTIDTFVVALSGLITLSHSCLELPEVIAIGTFVVALSGLITLGYS